MNKPICVRSSVHVKPTSDFNEWQQELAEERRFRRLINNMAAELVAARTKRKK